jgi:hypothetical protein
LVLTAAGMARPSMASATLLKFGRSGPAILADRCRQVGGIAPHMTLPILEPAISAPPHDASLMFCAVSRTHWPSCSHPGIGWAADMTGAKQQEDIFRPDRTDIAEIQQNRAFFELRSSAPPHRRPRLPNSAALTTTSVRLICIAICANSTSARTSAQLSSIGDCHSSIAVPCRFDQGKHAPYSRLGLPRAAARGPGRPGSKQPSRPWRCRGHLHQDQRKPWVVPSAKEFPPATSRSSKGRSLHAR